MSATPPTFRVTVHPPRLDTDGLLLFGLTITVAGDEDGLSPELPWLFAVRPGRRRESWRMEQKSGEQTWTFNIVDKEAPPCRPS